MNYSNILLHDKSTDVLNLPGSWPGELSDHIRTLSMEDGIECFINRRENPNLATLKNIMLVSSDNYASAGIRYRLQSLNHVRLKQYRDFSDLRIRAIHFKPDIIILAPESEYEMRLVLISVVTLNLKLSGAKLLVISRRNGLLQDLSLIWPFTYLEDTASPEEFDRATIQTLIKPTTNGFSIKQRLTKQQWRALCLISEGRSLCSAAKIMKISAKTLYTHRTKAMARLGIRNRLHEAWMADAIRLLNKLLATQSNNAPEDYSKIK